MRGVVRGARGSGTKPRSVPKVDRRPLNTVARWLLLLVALGGLLAMHGLSDHGLGTPGAVASVGSTAETSSMTSGTHEHGAASMEGDAAENAATPDARASQPDGDGSTGGSQGRGHGDQHGGAAAGMCLAVIVAALLFGVAAWRVGMSARLRPLFSAHLALAGAIAFWAQARGPAPPDLTVLSIQRC